jgi:murein DD-endopeptidase MepM/ murein hydrolase activator NlpD
MARRVRLLGGALLAVLTRTPGGGRQGPPWRLAVLSCPLVLLLALSACTIPRWPVEGAMTSPFGMRTLQGAFLPSVHHGVDIQVPMNTPVVAVLPGRVRFAGEMRGYGRVIWLEHRRGTLTVYAHLSEVSVRTGDAVQGRQEIGRSGASGTATGPHLHFEVWKGGRPVDPVQALGRRPRPTR